MKVRQSTPILSFRLKTSIGNPALASALAFILNILHILVNNASAVASIRENPRYPCNPCAMLLLFLET